jgi:predicted transposase YbfD/YdcC
LGQLKVDEKSNEIKAIPKLLEALALEGATVTIGAMRCQTDIAKTIVDNKANVVLAVKANQPLLLENIEDEFRFNKGQESAVDVDYGPGRIETRICSVIANFIHLEQTQKWANLYLL